MQHVLLAALFATVLGCGLQTVRLYRMSAEFVDAQRRLSQLSVVNDAYAQNALFALRASDRTTSEPEYLRLRPVNGMIIIVDTNCEACHRALLTLRTSGQYPPDEVVVASFRDSAAALKQWLDEIGWDGRMLATPLELTPLKDLPQAVTPLVIEFDQQEPVRIHIGQPRAAARFVPAS